MALKEAEGVSPLDVQFSLGLTRGVSVFPDKKPPSDAGRLLRPISYFGHCHSKGPMTRFPSRGCGRRRAGPSGPPWRPLEEIL